MNKDEVATAYGLLWLVMGDSTTDQNARLAYAARYRLRPLLDQEDMRRGIERAKELAKGLNVVVETWM